MSKDCATFKSNNKAYTMRLPFSALKKIEDHYDEPITEVTGRMAKGMRLSDLAVFVRFGLEGDHGEMSASDVDKILDAVGVDAVMVAVQSAFDDGTKGDPTKAAQER